MTTAIVERSTDELINSQSGEHMRSKKVFAPRADIYETKESIVVLADLPGIDQNSIDITLEKNVLTIFGACIDRTEKGLNLVYCECPEGNYRRVFLLSEEVDRNGIQASVKNGLLKLVLPKSADVKARKILVKSE